MNLTDFLKTGLAGQPFLVLIGHPVAHSLSPLMHNTAATYSGIDLTYSAVDVGADELQKLPDLFSHPNFRGANVTLPHKAAVIPMLDRIEDTAKSLGAVNTVYRADGLVCGTNTDIYGFISPLHHYLDRFKDADVVVFGTGGASRAVVYALGEAGVRTVYLVSRSPRSVSPHSFYSRAEIYPVSYDAWTHHTESCVMLVNTTPLGMDPGIDKSPVRENQAPFLSDKICYDLVYVPADTLFLKQARQAGGIAVPGLEMLVRQGSRSWEIWTGRPFPAEEVTRIIEKHLYGNS